MVQNNDDPEGGYLIKLLIVGLSIIVCKHLIDSVINVRRLPRSLGWADQPKGAFPKTRACIRQLFAGVQSLRAGYDQYNKNGKSFVMPGVGFGPIVILPQEHIAWLMSQPDSVLSTRNPQGGRIGIKYTMPYHDSSQEMFQVDIRKMLTPNLAKLQPMIFEDMRKSIDDAFGTEDGSWREVPLLPTMQNIVGSVINRIVVGQPLCSNPGYLASLSHLTPWLGGSGLVVGQLLPPVLKPVFGYLAAIPVYFYRRQAMSYLLPVIEERMNNIRCGRIDVFSEDEDVMSLLNWIAAVAVEGEDAHDLTAMKIASNILFLGLAGIFPTILTTVNVFLDILTFDPSQEVFQKIRDEAAVTLQQDRDWNDHKSIGKLALADSVFKETLRCNPLIFRAVLREVVQEEGVGLPDGNHLPQGAWLAVPIESIHHDERFFEKPDTFDAFRFARGSEGQVPLESSARQDEETGRKQRGFSTASDTFLGWGYGRHACPGRWFVSQGLKTLLAYIAIHYDIKPLEGERAKNRVMGDSMVPPQDTVISVRRRKVTIE